PYQLYHTLGYLNSRYEPRITSAASNYAGAPDAMTTGATPQTAAFPWLTFNNRPFMNPSECMLVPATNQYGLLANFSIRTTATAGADYNAFTAAFGHLFNFFQAVDSTGSGTAPPNLCRLFDFINVPSPFIQAESYFNYTNFNTANYPPLPIST